MLNFSFITIFTLLDYARPTPTGLGDKIPVLAHKVIRPGAIAVRIVVTSAAV